MEWGKESVKELRRLLDLTQDEFASLLGCRQQTISEWEHGLYAPANAYGKLLSQLQIQSARSFRSPATRERPVEVKDKVEDFINESETSEGPHFKPFDPAVD